MERIKVSIGKTINLGNLESLRLDVGLEGDTLTRDRQDVCDSMVSWIKDELINLEQKLKTERRK